MSKAITDEEFRLIIKEITKVKPYTLKIDYEIFKISRLILGLRLIRFLGIRPEEVRLIKISHIDFRQKQLFIPAENCKIRVSDYVPIPEFMLNNILFYLKIRCKFFNNQFLFSSNSKSEMVHKDYFYNAFRKISLKLGITQISFHDKKGHPHLSKTLYGLRKSFATKIYFASNKNYRPVAIALRHHDPMMRATFRYIDEAEDESRKEIFQQIYKEDNSYLIEGKS